MSHETFKCRVCNTEGLFETYTLSEMMYGLKESFQYVLCPNCNCLQIVEFPSDMTRFYPSDYYSFSPSTNKAGKFKSFVRLLRDRYAVYDKGVLGNLIYRYAPEPSLRSLSYINLNDWEIKKASILDVGCGYGRLLLRLKALGFDRLTGIDPFIDHEIEYSRGCKVLKMTIMGMEESGTYDLIMFHHSFEHISNPVETVKTVAQLLSPNGICLIRIPTIPCYAWERFRENWVQLDAPRHFFIHSEKSISSAALQSGLVLDKVVYDSTEFQFVGSERYEMGIPLLNNTVESLNKAKLKKFRNEAQQLNIDNRGDQAIFYLRKPTMP